MRSEEIQKGELANEQIDALLERAWLIRERAHVIGPTKVGCSVLTSEGHFFDGCNVEHRFRSHDVHAEVNAITNMVAAGQKSILAVGIAAERERFTPCGACMDWIMQFEAENCLVFAQSCPGGAIKAYFTHELMPFYPH